MRASWFLAVILAANVVNLTPVSVVPAEAESVRFKVDKRRTEARFKIDEELFGRPKLVIGTTSKVNGSVLVDLSGTQPLVFETFTVDAGDLKTDSSFRNRAMRGQILESNKRAFRYIRFKPLSVSPEPNPAEIELGLPLELSVEGLLTIRDVTRPAVFAMTVVPVSAELITGSATAVVKRSEFGIVIPELRGLANVDDNVPIEIDFVLEAD